MSGPDIALSRAFVALWLAADDAARLYHRAADSCPDPQARPLQPQDLHCTLCFLGDIDSPALTAIGEALGGIVADAVGITVDRLESWPGPAVLVACPQRVPSALATLQAQVAALVGAGGSPRHSHFRPHVTIRRRQRQACPTMSIEPVDCRFQDFVLAGTADAASPGRYRIVRRWPLGGGAN